MQTTTKRRSTTPVAKLLYPPVPDSDDNLFWLAIYFWDCAEAVALQTLVKEKHKLKRRPHDCVFYALYGAISHQKIAVKTSLGYVIQDGKLLFAHPATTIFDKPVAA